MVMVSDLISWFAKQAYHIAAPLPLFHREQIAETKVIGFTKRDVAGTGSFGYPVMDAIATGGERGS
jgi:hypothetical protein